MKVFIISNRNSESRGGFLVSYFTTIIGVRARRRDNLITLLGNNYPKECFILAQRIK
jgi:hypothetical protein